MFNKKIIYLYILVAIFLVATFLRFYNLSNFPVGFHIDEASLGYNAYSLLLTGKDDNNHALPLYIDMFGDNRPSGYHYLTIIPVKLFGLTIFATRFPAAFFGSISVFAIFLLTYALFKKKAIALSAALLLAIAPWHIVLSRASGEAVIALFFILVGFASIFLSIEKKKVAYTLLGGLLLAISFFFYHTPRVFVPLLFFAYLLYYFWKFRLQMPIRHQVAMVGTFLSVSLVAVALVFAVSGGTGRFTQVNIFSFPETKLVMQEQIREDGPAGTPVLLTRFYHNKLVNYSLTFVSNYFSYFTGDFLFIKGGLPIWYSVPNMGLIYLVELPFLLYGLFQLLLSKKQFSKMPLLWLLIAPVVASVTVDDVPNINRVIVLFPMIELITAFGMYVFVTNLQSKKVLASVSIALLFFANFLYFQHQYLVNASFHRTWYRNNGFEKMIDVLMYSYASVDKIVVSKEAGGYPLFLFFMQYDPKLYQSEGSPKDRPYGGFGKLFFVPQACPSIDSDSRFPKDKKIIFVDRGDCRDNKILLRKRYEYILKEDGTKAFRIVYD
jgi:4-amino-4-deoxy-L-arabinose transferase-like glycosyltransferase